MKSCFPKQFPTLIKYRNYKNFIRENFRNELQYKLLALNDDAKFEDFETIFMSILNKHAPMKEKLIRANNSPFMNKPLSKAIMTRSRLKNKFLKKTTKENKINYNKQRNYCVNLLRKVKKNYYANLDINNITDNKKFWSTVKPFFSDKSNRSKSITLIDGENIISNEKKVAETMNSFFSNAVKNLKIKGFKPDDVVNEDLDNISKIISKFKNHPSIIKIKQNIQINEIFSFSSSSLNEIENKIKDLNCKKPTTLNTIPTKILIDNRDISSKYIFKFYKESVHIGEFPNSMKMTEITPSHKKKTEQRKKIIGQSASCHLFQKFLKKICMKT